MNREQTKNIIETTGLSKRYGSTWALRECALAIPAGHVAALVGPNGAGKTTLLKLATGMLTPTRGTIRVLAARASRRGNVAYVAAATADRFIYCHRTSIQMTTSLSR